MRADLTFEEALQFNSSATQRREMAERAEQERAESRRLKLESQWSPDAFPAQRIRIWESLHALQLPRTAGHPLLAVIARQTHLSLADIEGEQSRRRLELAPAASVPP
jgi:hypothetical protein